MQFESTHKCSVTSRGSGASRRRRRHALTQSAASQIVHQLEKRLGVQLIDRSTRPLQLTPLGPAVLRRLQGARRAVRGAGGVHPPRRRPADLLRPGRRDLLRRPRRHGPVHRPLQDAVRRAARSHRVRASEYRLRKVLGRTAELGLVSFPRKTARTGRPAVARRGNGVGLRPRPPAGADARRSRRSNSKGCSTSPSPRI